MNFSTSHFSSSIASSKRNKVMTPEQFNQVVAAITEGHYSWACVLILRFAGYNPVHFIPYRTYSRLIKENSAPNHQIPANTASAASAQSFVKVDNLAHLEAIDSREGEMQGGHCLPWLKDLPEQPAFVDRVRLNLQEFPDTAILSRIYSLF